MAKLAFILGAGASAEGGCPVMSNFLATARRIASEMPDSDYARHYRTVHQVQQQLQRANVKAKLDFENIESILTAIEMGQTVGALGDFDDGQLQIQRTALLELIARTVDATQRMRIQRPSGGKLPLVATGPTDYQALAAVLFSLLRSRYDHSVDIITFNYDIGLEIALASQWIKYTYCLPGVEDFERLDGAGAPEKLVRLCKLHGSLNWIRADPQASVPRIRCFDPYWELERQLKGSSPSSATLDSSLGRASLVESSASAAALPFIVPPGEAKASYRAVMQEVWKAAHGVLREADHVYICGYSLPETDVFFRQFFALSMISDVILRRVVINCFDDGEALRRLESMFGSMVVSDPGVFKRENVRFHEWVNSWGKKLNSAGYFM